MKSSSWAILGFSLLGFLAVGEVARLASKPQKNPLTYQERFGLLRLHSKILTALQSEEHWRVFLYDEANASLRCLREKSDCRGQQGQFRMRTPAGETIFDPTLASLGFTLAGEQCRPGFEEPCPLRLKLHWMPLCESDFECTKATAFVHGEVSVWGKSPLLLRKEVDLDLLAAAGVGFHDSGRVPVASEQSARGPAGGVDLSFGAGDPSLSPPATKAGSP